MKLISKASTLKGQVDIPASKSHTIRAVYIGGLADGVSELIKPLDALDTQAAVHCMESFGAKITKGENWTIQGLGGRLSVPENILDVMNSGTSTNIFMGLAATIDGYTVLTGDESIRRRPVQPLIDCLNDLGAKVFSTRENGYPPIVIKGPIKGGRTVVEGRTSIYTSALLFNCPMGQGDSELIIENPRELPYIDMTTGWLDEQNITYTREGYNRYFVPGGQAYKPFKRQIPGDFSTATFFLCAAAISGSDVLLRNLDMNDTQGDKRVVDFLREMGADIRQTPEGLLVTSSGLKGIEIDLADTPDALPALAVVGCFAEGETRIRNVLSARWKETDRISVMNKELTQLGARVEELEDGITIGESKLHGGTVSGHKDHRVVMALSMAGLRIPEGLEIETAESVQVTAPNFVELMRDLGADLNFQN